MLLKIKNAVKRNKFLLNLLIPLVDNRIPFYIHRLFNNSFNIKFLNGKTIKMYSKGQIALSIFSKKFEKQEVDVLQRIIKKGMTIVDAGANIGFYSLIASGLVGPTGKVISFEPSKETFTRLLDNIKLNEFSNIIPFNNGLGDKANEKLVLRQDVGYKDAERYLFPGNKAPDTKIENISILQRKEEVILDTLDNCLKNLNITKVDFIKIDTEGYEYYILKGAKNILQNSPEAILLMECTASGAARVSTTQEIIFSMLKEFGLNIFYWNTILNDWCDDEAGILEAGNVWGCKDKNQLSF